MMTHSRWLGLLGIFLSTTLLADVKDLPFYPKPLFNEARELHDLEFEIFRRFSNYKSEGYSTSTFYEKIVDTLNAGRDLDVEWLEEYELRYSQLHKIRHHEIQRKQHVLITASHSYVSDLVSHLLQKKYPIDCPSQNELLNSDPLKKSFERLDSEFFGWSQYSDALGEGVAQKDQARRMYSFRSYFNALRKMFQNLGYAPALKSTIDPNLSYWTRYSNQIAMGTATFWTGLKVLSKAYLSPWDAYQEPVNQNSTPLMNGTLGVVTAFQSLAAAQGYQIEVLGKENLAKIELNGISGEKVINLFIAPHRHTLKDQMAVTSLGLPHYLMFANTGAFAKFQVLGRVFTFFAKAVAYQPEIIPVGEILGISREPKRTIDQFIYAAGVGVSPNGVDHLHGFVANAGEILPVSASAVRGLFEPILNQGFQLNLIPLSFETDSDFMSLTGDVDDHKIVVKIHPPILHAATAALVRYQISKLERNENGSTAHYLEHFFSTLWFENIQKHGELSWDDLNNRLNSALGFNFCGTRNLSSQLDQEPLSGHREVEQLPLSLEVERALSEIEGALSPQAHRTFGMRERRANIVQSQASSATE